MYQIENVTISHHHQPLKTQILARIHEGDSAAAQSQKADLVEEMIPDAVAELLIGVQRDPAHGFVLTLAAGGVLTELWGDSASMLVPAGRDSVQAALQGLKIAPVLNGYRGKAAASEAAILDAVQALQDYVLANAALVEEAEVNPLICTETRAVAVDALIRKGQEMVRDMHVPCQEAFDDATPG